MKALLLVRYASVERFSRSWSSSAQIRRVGSFAGRRWWQSDGKSIMRLDLYGYARPTSFGMRSSVHILSIKSMPKSASCLMVPQVHGIAERKARSPRMPSNCESVLDGEVMAQSRNYCFHLAAASNRVRVDSASLARPKCSCVACTIPSSLRPEARNGLASVVSFGRGMSPCSRVDQNRGKSSQRRDR